MLAGAGGLDLVSDVTGLQLLVRASHDAFDLFGLTGLANGAGMVHRIVHRVASDDALAFDPLVIRRLRRRREQQRAPTRERCPEQPAPEFQAVPSIADALIPFII